MDAYPLSIRLNANAGDAESPFSIPFILVSNSLFCCIAVEDTDVITSLGKVAITVK
jgi:hypothetical protein